MFLKLFILERLINYFAFMPLMKIAQISPLHESVPPMLYGGTERDVHYLTEELVKMGHEVTLYASGDSKTSAELKPMCKKSLRMDKNCVDPVPDHLYMAERVCQDSGDFDIIHSHLEYLGFPMLRRAKAPSVTTLHGRLDYPNYVGLFMEFRDMPLISISNSQRGPLPWANWIDTVYHGIPKDIYELNEGKGEYLAFLGRISPEKGVDKAIKIAERANTPLRIAAKVGKEDRENYEEVIMPLIEERNAEFIGEINKKKKDTFLGNTSALLFPINWPEPFGLAKIEAMACGTPVIAFPFGSVPEVIDEGKTGFIVKDVDGAARSVKKLPLISRVTCSKIFEKRFT